MEKVAGLAPLEQLKNELVTMVKMEDLEVLKADHKHIPITDLEDKEQYEATKAQWQKTRNTRLELDKKKKEADAKFKEVTGTIKDAYTNEYNALYEALKPEEDKGRAEMKKVEDAEELKRIQKEKEYSDKMFEAGFVRGRMNEWVCGNVVVSEADYKENREASIDLWVADARAYKEAERKEKEEAEKKRLEDEERAKELKAKEEELARREAALKVEEKKVEAPVEHPNNFEWREIEETSPLTQGRSAPNVPVVILTDDSPWDTTWNDAVLACIQATEGCTTVEQAQSNILSLMR
jgi:hypothetical protein